VLSYEVVEEITNSDILFWIICYNSHLLYPSIFDRVKPNKFIRGESHAVQRCWDAIGRRGAMFCWTDFN